MSKYCEYCGTQGQCTCGEPFIDVAKLRADLAEREAEIAKLREALIGWFEEEISDLQLDEFAAALSTPPSTSYLEQWEKDRYSLQCYSYSINDTHVGFSHDEPPDDAYDEGSLVPLYARKEK